MTEPVYVDMHGYPAQTDLLRRHCDEPDSYATLRVFDMVRGSSMPTDPRIVGAASRHAGGPANARRRIGGSTARRAQGQELR